MPEIICHALGLTVQFEHCSLDIIPADEYVQTTFGDKVAPGRPHDDEEYKALAEACGCESTYWYLVEHEYLHSRVRELQGQARSGVLWNVAHGQTAPIADQLEELQVLQVQLLLPSKRKYPTFAQIDLDQLREELAEVKREYGWWVEGKKPSEV